MALSFLYGIVFVFSMHRSALVVCYLDIEEALSKYALQRSRSDFTLIPANAVDGRFYGYIFCVLRIWHIPHFGLFYCIVKS